MAGSTQVAAPAQEPVTLEECRSHCRLTDSSEDGIVTGYLLAARALAEESTGRALVTQTWTETYDNDWPRSDGSEIIPYQSTRRLRSWSKRRISLPRPPIQSITSITYVDATLQTVQTLDPSQYQLGKRQVINVVEEAFGCTWPAVQCQIDTIAVTYVCGYAPPSPIPEVIRQAILLLVGHFYANREATVVSASRMSVSELPIGVEALLSKKRIPWVF